MLVYAGAGIGATLYHTMINALDASGNPYTALFNSIPTANETYKNRKDVLDVLKDGMDDSYETEAENQGARRPKMGKNTLKPSGTVLVGLAFKLESVSTLLLKTGLLSSKMTFLMDSAGRSNLQEMQC